MTHSSSYVVFTCIIYMCGIFKLWFFRFVWDWTHTSPTHIHHLYTSSVIHPIPQQLASVHLVPFPGYTPPAILLCFLHLFLVDYGAILFKYGRSDYLYLAVQWWKRHRVTDTWHFKKNFKLTDQTSVVTFHSTVCCTYISRFFVWICFMR